MLAVDLAGEMLAKLCALHGCAGPLGNEPGVRPWLGDVETLPSYQASCGPWPVCHPYSRAGRACSFASCHVCRAIFVLLDRCNRRPMYVLHVMHQSSSLGMCPRS